MGFISEIIGVPLGYIMWALYSVFKNYGVAILLFTVITRLILVPISVKQQKSTASMAALNPKIEKLKKQYANNPNKLNEEQMKLYSEENINPMASCLPLVLQLLLLYGVFDVIYRPLKHILHISKETITVLTEAAKHLYEGNTYFSSRPEMYIIQAVNDHADVFANLEGVEAGVIEKIASFNNKLFGVVDLGAIPKSVLSSDTVWTLSTVILLLIPILSGVIQLAMTIYSTRKQKKLNPAASTQMGGMNMMMYIMPVFSVVIAYSFPAGIGFYWICSSAVGFIQSILLNKIYTPEYVSKLIEKDKIKNKAKKKSGIMQKYNEIMQEQMKQNNPQVSGNSDRAIAASGIKRDSETGEDIKLSKSQMKEYERKIIAEARKRQAEKYGEEYIDDNDD